MISKKLRCTALAIALGAFLYFVYLLSFNGLYTTGDEEIIIDTTAGFAVRSGPERLLLNQTFYLRGLVATDVEPAQPLLAAPLYWIAYHIDWIGTIHALFLFNPIITALTGIVIFFYALHLGYGKKLALTAALLFGLTTIAWPYTRTFFRESLTMLTLVSTAYFMDRWRDAFMRHDLRSTWLWGMLALIAGVFAALTKEAVLIAIPLLIVFAIPAWSTLSRRKREIVWIALFMLVIAAMLTGGVLLYRENVGALAARYELLGRMQTFLTGLPSAWYATLGYLFSPGRGIFWYSPILLLAVGAPMILPRAKWREAWMPLTMLLVFAFVYAAVRGVQWYGGKSWGGRYMVPIVPLIMLGTLPLLERIWESKRIAPKIILVILIVLGFAIQVGSVLMPIDAFLNYQSEQTALAPWSDTIVWSVQWSQAIGTLLYLPTYLQTHNPDILWFIPQLDGVAFVVIVVGLLVSTAGIFLAHRYQRVWQVATGIGLPFILISGISLFVLARAYDDPRYFGTDEGLQMLREALAQEAAPEDLIMLSSPRYIPYFLNYFKGQQAWYPLPVSPGETSSCEQAPLITSDNPREVIDPEVEGVYSRFIEHKRSLWAVVDYGPMQPCATRPVERYYASVAYLIQSEDFTPTVRLVEYNLMQVPQDALPTTNIGVRFGEHLVLEGFDLADDPVHHLDELIAGDRIGVSLVWHTNAPLEIDYTFAVYLVGPAGTVIAQQDRSKYDLFPPTSQWEVGQSIRLNYGFILPEPLPPGEYQLWVAVYSWPSPVQPERLRVLGSDESDLGDYYVLTSLSIK